MSNPFTAAVSWLAGNPLVSHAVIATALTGAIASALHAGHVPNAAIAAGVIVSTFFFGREAGQREHDLKHQTPPKSPFQAMTGAYFGFGWSLDNLVQWLVAAGSSTAAAVGLKLLRV